MRDPSPVVRLFNLQLAAAAPELRMGLRQAVHLTQRLVPEVSYQWKRDGRRVREWQAILRLTRPGAADVEAALAEGLQLLLEFHRAA